MPLLQTQRRHLLYTVEYMEADMLPLGGQL